MSFFSPRRLQICGKREGDPSYSVLWIFYAPAWKVRRGHLVIGSSVCLSVRNSVPLTNKVQYLKFGWWYSNQTWTVKAGLQLVKIKSEGFVRLQSFFFTPCRVVWVCHGKAFSRFSVLINTFVSDIDIILGTAWSVLKVTHK